MEQTTVERAYVNAWTDMHNPTLDSVNPHFKNRFASLRETLSVIRTACAGHGIAYRQLYFNGELHSSVICDSGDVMDLSQFPVAVNADPQKFGSALTYAKRQQAQADWCIVGEEDDDAEAAAKGSQRPPEPTRAPQTPTRDYQTLKAELTRLAALHGTTMNDEWSWLCQTYGNPKGMGDEDYASLVAIIKELEA